MMKFNELLKEIRSLKELFQRTTELMECYICSETAAATDYNRINNILLNLESDLLDLTTISGK